jgi:hypothetical protein
MTTAYGRGVLDRRCAEVRDESEGARNYALVRAATTVAGFIAGGEIGAEDARAVLTEAGLAAGLGEGETRATIESGFRRGVSRPLHRPPSWSERATRGEAP